MPPSSARRPWLVVALVAAVLAAVLLVGIGGAGDDPAASPAPGSSASGTAPVEPAPTERLPADFCADFLVFVEASTQHTASPDDRTGDTLVAAARTLLEMPSPLGMTPGARASLDQLVAATLEGVEDADVAPDPTYAAEPDQQAFDEYLRATCPA